MELIALALLLGFGLSSDQEDAGTAPIMHDPKFPSILSVTIKENGATSPAASSSDEGCADFVLQERDVLEYLRNAKEVTQHDYYHMLDWSPCYASGVVKFKGGATGVWGIQQLRAGSLRLSTGKQYFLYCPTCSARALQPGVGR